MMSDSPGVQKDVGTLSAAETIQAAARFLRVVRSRLSYLLVSVAVAALLGLLYFATATRIYQAKASLLVTQTGRDVWNTSTSTEGGHHALIPTHERLFTSAVVLGGAVRALKRMPPEARLDFRGIPEREWPDRLRENLAARGLRRTNIIELTYRSRSPQAAKAVVSAVVQSYISFVRKTHRDVSAEVVGKLQAERQHIERELQARQQELLQARRRVKVLGIKEGSDTVHPAVHQVLQLNKSLVEVQEQRIDLEATLAAVRDAVRSGGDLRQHLLAIEPAVGREMFISGMGLNAEVVEVIGQVERKLLEDRARLASLSEHLGPVHPQIVELERSVRESQDYLDGFFDKIDRRLDGLRQAELGPLLTAMVEEQLAKVRAHEQALERQYTLAEAEAVERNESLAELTIAERNLERVTSLHDALLNRIANIDMTQDQADIRVAVVTEPMAMERPVSPKLLVVALAVLAIGLGGGALIIYVVDALDDRFRSPDEIKQQLGAPVLAIVRELSLLAETGIEALPMHVAPRAPENDAFRTLRTTLALSGRQLERLAVTSSEPSDGKTTVLANLAVSLAQSGRKTLLIDADLRRPGLSRLLGMRRQEGLSDVLRGQDEVAAMSAARIQPTGIDGLDLLPSGPKPLDPAELLSGGRLAELVAWAETRYDQVLVDCPPALAARDAALIGRLTDGCVLVVQPAKNHRRLVLRAAESLREVDVTLLGVVANRVAADLEGDYYGYGYGYGEADDDDGDPPPSNEPAFDIPHRTGPRRDAA